MKLKVPYIEKLKPIHIVVIFNWN